MAGAAMFGWAAGQLPRTAGRDIRPVSRQDNEKVCAFPDLTRRVAHSRPLKARLPVAPGQDLLARIPR